MHIAPSTCSASHNQSAACGHSSSSSSRPLQTAACCVVKPAYLTLFRGNNVACVHNRGCLLSSQGLLAFMPLLHEQRMSGAWLHWPQGPVMPRGNGESMKGNRRDSMHEE